MIKEMFFSISTHVKKHNNTGGKSSIEQKLEGAHLRVPSAKEFASYEIISGENCVKNEVEYRQPGRIWRNLINVLI